MSEASWLKSSLAEKDVEVLVDASLTVGHCCALVTNKASGILSCFRRRIVSKSREVILPLYSALWRHI